MSDLRYPIGEFRHTAPLGPDGREACIARIAVAPALLRAAVEGLGPEQLDTPYRQGGWTVRQVVHHLPDSHANGYVRFRLALTEPTPVITPYDEPGWARLPDAATGPVEHSLALLEALHRRWVLLLQQIGPEDWRRAYHHPGQRRDIGLEEAVALYAWHGEHHTAHITSLSVRMGWRRPAGVS
jgi:hypothetical protein